MKSSLKISKCVFELLILIKISYFKEKLKDHINKIELCVFKTQFVFG